MSYCPYSDEELQFWDSVSNPMGDACDDCDDYDCEHNPNMSPEEATKFEMWYACTVEKKVIENETNSQTNCI